MKKIKEYILDKRCLTPQTFYMPKSAEAFTVQDSEDGLRLVVFVSVKDSSPVLRTFKICTKNENIYVDNIKYIDKFMSSSGIRYVIEIIRERID